MFFAGRNIWLVKHLKKCCQFTWYGPVKDKFLPNKELVRRKTRDTHKNKINKVSEAPTFCENKRSKDVPDVEVECVFIKTHTSEHIDQTTQTYFQQIGKC